MSVSFVGLLVMCLVGVAAGLLVLAMIPEEDLVERHSGDIGTERKFGGIFLKIFGGLVVSLGGLFSVLPLAKRREKLNVRLVQAGMPGGLSADEFMASQLIALVLGVLVGAYFDLELDSSPVALVLMGGLGFLYPDIWLSGTVAKRKRSIFRDLPDTVDTLRLAMDAGLDFGGAMKVVVERARPGALISELEKVERDMSLGKTRQESLRAFAERIAMTEVNAFVLALIQADQLGASISPILKVQGEMARKRRWTYAEEVVNKLPMKMLAPLVALIFPASFIILFTPLVIQYMQSPS